MRRSRIDSFNSLRALACLTILGYHMHLTSIGHMFVTIFFVLSGFLSVYNHIDGFDTGRITARGCFDYARDKALKLYPLYFLTLLVPLAGQIYGAVNGMVAAKAVALKLGASLLLVQSWIPINDVYFGLNGAAWYLSSLIFVYFMFPVVLRFIKKLRSGAAAVGVIAAMCAMQLVIRDGVVAIYTAVVGVGNDPIAGFSYWAEYVLPLVRVCDFTIGGCVAYLFINRGETRIPRAVWTAAEAVLLGLTIWLQVEYSAFKLPLGNSTVVFLPVAAALIYAFAVNEGYVSKLLTNRVTKWISDISAEVYLCHAAVIFAMTPIINAIPAAFRVQQVIYVVTIPLAVACVALVGQRINRAFARRRRARSAA